MKKSRLVKYYKKLENSFGKHFKRTSMRQGVNDIHQLRVSIKKIRAVLSLIEVASKNQYIKTKHFNMLAPLFKIAGRVREAQLNIKAIHKFDFNGLEAYLAYQEKIVRKSNKKMLREIWMFDFKKLNSLDKKLYRTTKRLSNNAVKKESEEFFEKKVCQINKLKSKVEKDKNLHKIRIHLKVIRELLIILDKLEPSEELKAIRNDLNELYEAIGLWHDDTVLIDSLEQYLGRISNKKEVRKINKAIEFIEVDNRANKEKVVNLLDEYLML